MAQIDVTSVLLGPMFGDWIGLTRKAITVNTGGLATVSDTSSRIFGVVTNKEGDVLSRLPEGERISGSITIHSKSRLIAGDAQHTADIVTWQKRPYTVKAVNDYSNFGRGFYAADCDLLPLSG